MTIEIRRQVLERTIALARMLNNVDAGDSRVGTEEIANAMRIVFHESIAIFKIATGQGWVTALSQIQEEPTK